jgi:prepilin-type N-terminal cleavage/methylation domain-containing protein
MRVRARASRAFSAIEVIVVVAVIAIIVAVSMPMLSRARQSARRQQCLEHLGGHMRVLAAYAASSNDAWPYPFREARKPPRTDSIGPDPFGGDWYDAASGLWYQPVLDAYRDDPVYRTLICPSDPDGAAIRDLAAQRRAEGRRLRWTLDYRLSMAMYLDPVALDPEHPKRDPALYQGQRHGDVVFPSAKAALFESTPFHEPWFRAGGMTRFPPYILNVALVDGSVAARNTGDAVPGVLFPLTYFPLREGVQRADIAAMHTFHYTPWGVRGRDLTR